MAKGVLVFVAVFFTGVFYVHGECEGLTNTSAFISDEKTLYNCLLKNYTRYVRPAKQPNDTINVRMDMMLLKITDLVEKDHVMITHGWLYKRWTDYQLAWDPKQFGGIKEMNLPIRYIWKPDVVLFNDASDQPSRIQWDQLALVQNNGEVHWVPHVLLRSFCEFKLSRFPFDSQKCDLVFGSWTYDITRMTVGLAEPIRHNFIFEGDEWKLVKFDRSNKSISVVKDKDWSVVVFSVELERISAYYRFLYVGPSVLLAFLTLFIFCIPPQANERITLGCIIILAIVLLFMMLENHLPTDLGEVPSIAMYLTFNLVMVIWALLLSILVLNFHHRDNRKDKVPEWLRRVFLGNLSRWLCVRGEPYASVPSDPASTSRLNFDAEDGPEQELPKSPTLAMQQTLEEIRRYLKICASNSSAQETPSHRQLVQNEWHQLAIVFDRLMFIIFIIISIIVTVGIYAH